MKCLHCSSKQTVKNGQLATQIRSLSFTQLEALGEGLLDFTSLTDLETWLAFDRR